MQLRGRTRQHRRCRSWWGAVEAALVAEGLIVADGAFVAPGAMVVAAEGGGMGAAAIEGAAMGLKVGAVLQGAEGAAAGAAAGAGAEAAIGAVCAAMGAAAVVGGMAVARYAGYKSMKERVIRVYLTNLTNETLVAKDARKEAFGQTAGFPEEIPPQHTGVVEFYLGNVVTYRSAGRTVCLGGGFPVTLGSWFGVYNKETSLLKMKMHGWQLHSQPPVLKEGDAWNATWVYPHSGSRYEYEVVLHIL